MSIFVRLFLVYGLALTLGGALLLRDVQQQIRPGMKEVLEDTLADNAQALAAALAPALEHGDITNPAWQAQLRARLARPQDIHIHQHHKTANRQQLIITDSAGIVLFHSEAAETGKDYSRWNDILRTLRGEYGARSTQNTMYIAAPVHAADGRLLGVVSLGKPGTDLIPYPQRTEHDLRQSGLLYLGATLALIALLTLWIRRSIDRVRRYATAHAPIPPAPRFHLASELNRLTAAIGDMRRELEDRAYITRYIETLTHELKSPLTAISASAELLQDDLPAADRARFADNIAQQSARLHRLVQRLLQLSRIEKEPVHKQPLDLAALWHKHQREQQPRLAQKNLTLRLRHNGTDADEHTAIPLNADPFWLEQALANLLDNAMREAPAGSIITLAVSQNRQETRIALHNPTRAPVPDYALPRLFERYYTLNRKENSGLGLTLVAQIAEQHGGTACAENRDGGLTITLVLPA